MYKRCCHPVCFMTQGSPVSPTDPIKPTLTVPSARPGLASLKLVDVYVRYNSLSLSDMMNQSGEIPAVQQPQHGRGSFETTLNPIFWQSSTPVL